MSLVKYYLNAEIQILRRQYFEIDSGDFEVMGARIFTSTLISQSLIWASTRIKPRHVTSNNVAF